MLLIALAIGLGFLTVAGVLAWTRRAPAQAAPPPAPATDGPRTAELELAQLVGTLAARIAALEVEVKGLPGLWTEEADRAERAAERERKAAARHRAQRQNDLEGAGGEPAPADVRGGEEGGMPPMHGGMAPAGGSDEEAYLRAVRQQLAFLPLRG